MVADSLVSRFGQTLANLDHLLRQCTSATDVVGTLHSRLAFMPEYQDLIAALENDLPRPFITAWQHLPDHPHPALRRVIVAHTRRITDCAVGAGGRLVASGSDDRMLRIWEADTGKLCQEWELDPQYGASHCSLSADGTFVAAVMNNLKLFVAHVATGEVLFNDRYAAHDTLMTGCAISPDNRWVLIGSQDKTLTLFDLSALRTVHVLRGHQAEITRCCFGPDGQTIVSAADNELIIWDAMTLDLVRTLTIKGALLGLSLSPTGDRALVNLWLKTAVIDLAGEAEPVILKPLQGGRVCAWSSNGRWLAASADGYMAVWNAATLEPHLTLKTAGGSPSSMAFLPDSDVLVTGLANGQLRWWDMAADVGAYPADDLTHRRVRNLAMTPDGQHGFTITIDHALCKWDMVQGRVIQTTLPLDVNYTANDLVVSPDGRTLAVSDWLKHVDVFDTHTLERVGRLPSIAVRVDDESPTSREMIFAVFGLSFSPDGQWIAGGAENGAVVLWDAATREQVAILRGHEEFDKADEYYWCRYHVNRAQFSPDGRWLVSCSDDRTLKLWDVATWQVLHTFEGHESGVCRCVFSPDGQWIASGSMDQTVRLWRVEIGTEECVMRGHQDGICGCTFHPDGHTLLTASRDGSLRLWSVPDGKAIASFFAEDQLHDCAFYPDGKRIVANGDLGIYWLRFEV